ncbi:MAG: CHRD domain-containing protein [Alphaproteobacteria bacterium]|nr:CHRD domain-containing protein [Alphaproteobacteria bacterium]
MNRRVTLITALSAMLFACLPAHAQMTTRDFHTDLSAWNQTRLTESGAIGSADLALDLTTLTLTWEVHFNGLESRPIAASLHGPSQPGANGLAFIDLAPNGIISPLKGSAVVTEAEVQYLLAGWTYVNITTDRWPYGEIRGQVDVGPRN